MGLDNIKIPTQLLASLYSNILVSKATTKTSEEAIISPPSAISYLGENKKGVLVVVKESDVPFIQEDSLQLLTTILAACRLNISDIAIVNIANQKIVQSTLLQQFSPFICICFDILSKDIELPFVLPLFKPYQHANCTYLFAPSLTSMLGESQVVKEAKKNLWLSLKSIFKL